MDNKIISLLDIKAGKCKAGNISAADVIEKAKAVIFDVDGTLYGKSAKAEAQVKYEAAVFLVEYKYNKDVNVIKGKEREVFKKKYQKPRHRYHLLGTAMQGRSAFYHKPDSRSANQIQQKGSAKWHCTCHSGKQRKCQCMYR